MEQESELDLRVPRQLRPRRPGDLQPVGGHALGVLAGIGVTRLDRVAQRPHGRHVRALKGLRALPLGDERRAQIRCISFELAVGGHGLRALVGHLPAQRDQLAEHRVHVAGRDPLILTWLPHA